MASPRSPFANVFEAALVGSDGAGGRSIRVGGLDASWGGLRAFRSPSVASRTETVVALPGVLAHLCRAFGRSTATPLGLDGQNLARYPGC